MSDIFVEYEKRRNEVEHKRRRDLAKRYGKKCKTCGGTEMVAAPDTPGGRRPCPACRHRRNHGSHKH